MSRGGESETISKSESGLGTDLSEVQSPRSASWPGSVAAVAVAVLVGADVEIVVVVSE